MHETGHSKPVHWDNQSDDMGREVGEGVWDGGHMCTHGWLMSRYGKNNYSIVK